MLFNRDMRAILCKEWGNLQALAFEELPLNELKANEVRIKVHTVGLQHNDILMIEGRYQAKPPFPFIPGGEVAGEVVALGKKVSHLNIGDRVLALCETGGLAEYVQTSRSNVLSIPEYLSFEYAVALGTAYITAYVGLTQRIKLMPKDTLLVLGASGTMGLAAVNIGKLLGVEVIAVGSTVLRLQEAKKAGAAHLIPYQEREFKPTLKALIQDTGLQAVYDPVGGELFEQTLGYVGSEGHILTIGFASGRIPQLAINRLLFNNISISGLYFQAYKKKYPERIQAAFQQLLTGYEAGALSPFIADIFSFEEAQKALQQVKTRERQGRIIVSLIH